jgi:hypothetical protein
MGKKTKAKKPYDFEGDKCTTVAAKNRKLAAHLTGIWLKHKTVKIRRIESNVESGWKITYEKQNDA